jgi:plasmid maintenance system antidote protein VapI
MKTAKEYANEFDMTVEEWAESLGMKRRNLNTIVSSSGEKLNNILFLTTIRKYGISDYQELLKILEIHKLQKELSK